VRNLTTLKDAIHNVAAQSGASDDYARGIVVGAVAGMMATGMTWHNAMAQVAITWPANEYAPREAALPESWVDAFQTELRGKK
jgi:hypothetical protein